MSLGAFQGLPSWLGLSCEVVTVFLQEAVKRHKDRGSTFVELVREVESVASGRRGAVEKYVP